MDNDIKKFSASTGGFYVPSIHGADIPKDAVDVSDDDYAALFAAQAAGKIIVADESGHPVAVSRPALTGSSLILSDIANLEASITPRRIRESVLGLDNGWLKNINDQITSLRAQLKQ